MNVSSRRALPLLLATVACLSGCALQGIIQDISEQQTEVENLHLKEHETLTIFDGNGTRRVPLSSIRQLFLSARRSRVIDGELFYQANIVFRNDGGTLGNRRSSEFDENSVFVMVADHICGKNNDGKLCVPLDRVLKIEIPQ